MEELIKLLVDLLSLSDAARKGMFSWRIILAVFGVMAVIFVVMASAISYADKHPGPAADKALIATVVFAGLALGATVIWGWRYQNRLAARRAKEASAPPATT